MHLREAFKSHAIGFRSARREKRKQLGYPLQVLLIWRYISALRGPRHSGASRRAVAHLAARRHAAFASSLSVTQCASAVHSSPGGSPCRGIPVSSQRRAGRRWYTISRGWEPQPRAEPGRSPAGVHGLGGPPPSGAPAAGPWLPRPGCLGSTTSLMVTDSSSVGGGRRSCAKFWSWRIISRASYRANISIGRLIPWFSGLP